MYHFAPFPIYVVYSRQNQLDAAYEVDELYREKQYEQQRSVSADAITREDTDRSSQFAARNYYLRVASLLRKISSTKIGAILLKQFKTAVYIVPRTGGCYCAQTYPLIYQIAPEINYSRGKGASYIWFAPDEKFQDDVLFHELVHAYRFAFDKFEPRSVANGEYNTEEFLAHQLQNIYLSELKKPIYFTYRTEEISTKARIYEHFLTNPEFPMVLKYFLRHEYLAMLAAHVEGSDYNPFRDAEKIEQKYLERLGDPTIKTLPRF